jgi:hypothetical protein
MSERICNFSEPDGFKNCVYNYFCQCYSQCIGLSTDFKPKQEICSEIKEDIDVTDFNYYDEMITNTIEYFIDNDLLIKLGTKYYIIGTDKNKTKLKLRWGNIKTIDDKKVQELFWLFRKIVVDSILKRIIKKSKISRDDIQIYSVGSIKLTSDYDITLYGKIESKIKIIKQFQKIFKKYFKEDSSLVFDTNIYGKAYISFDPMEHLGNTLKSKCDNQEFYYLRKNSSQNSQLMWGLIKYLRDIRDVFDEKIFNELYNFMKRKLPNFHVIQYAFNTLIYLRNKDLETVNYITLLKNEQSFINKYEDKSKLNGIHDFISVLNFYGTETYFTRGAFIDTVVNSQMCNKIPLTEVDYITSILENVGFFFIHSDKTKYLLRINNSIRDLQKKYVHYKAIEKIVKPLKNSLENLKTINTSKFIDYDEKYCNSWINYNTEEIQLLKCQKYNFFNILMNLVFKILKTYVQHHIKELNEPVLFYENFVIKSTEEFGKSDDLSPIKTYSINLL